MTKKRKSGGRTGGNKGAAGNVTCASCNKLVPRDKAKKVTRTKSFVDPMIYKELRKDGALIPRQTTISYYCINCAVHRHVVSIRSKDDRKTHT